MKSVLFIQPNLFPAGGANTVAAWTIEALKREFALTVLSWTPIDLEAVNAHFGTSFRVGDFKMYHSPGLLRALYALDRDVESIQGTSLLMRLCKLVGHRFDVLMSAADEIDFGRRGIQYMHYPYLCGVYRTCHPPANTHGWARWKSLAQRIRPWRVISGFSFERMKDNLILVNSDWTAGKVEECYGIVPRTMYPPVPGDFPSVAWSERENGFVCLSSISEDKRLGQIIHILAAVRSRGQDVHLHIIGVKWNTPRGRVHYQQIRQMVADHASWVQLHESLPREQVASLLARHKYGMHRKEDEHFGIAVAEMMRAGCIVFTHRSGGQVEIIGNEDRLSFETDEEAAEKIIRAMGHPGEQTSLRDYLDARKDLFSTEHFMREMAATVRDFVSSE